MLSCPYLRTKIGQLCTSPTKKRDTTPATSYKSSYIHCYVVTSPHDTGRKLTEGEAWLSPLRHHFCKQRGSMLPFNFLNGGLCKIALVALFAVAIVPTKAMAQQIALHELDLPDVRGGTFQPENQHPRLLLVAFLSLVSADPDSSSLRESVFLSSMQRQYSARGLSVVAIDTSSVHSNRYIATYEIAKVRANWHLDFPVLDGSDGTLIRRFESSRKDPTILLISGSGIVVDIWHGFTRPAYLAQAIERQLGGSLSRIPQLPESKR